MVGVASSGASHEMTDMPAATDRNMHTDERSSAEWAGAATGHHNNGSYQNVPNTPGMSEEDLARLQEEEEERRIDEAIAAAERRST